VIQRLADWAIEEQQALSNPYRQEDKPKGSEWLSR
jgi:hypothetical protein